MNDDVTVAALDIARMAGVGRAAVSNWRRRYGDFPKPVGGTATSPRFSLTDVEAWLERHDKPVRVSAVDRLWQRLRTEVEDLRLGEFVGALGGCLLLAQRAPRMWTRLARMSDDRCARELPAAITDAAPDLLGALPEAFEVTWVAPLRMALEVAAEEGDIRTYEHVCARYTEAHARRLPSSRADLAALMIGLASITLTDEDPADDAPAGAVLAEGAPTETGTEASAGRTVLDPSCGTGTVLDAARSASIAALLLGQDADESAARITAARLLLAGAPARIGVGDALDVDAFSDAQADIVVCDPIVERPWPLDGSVADQRWVYGLPPRGEAELAWIQHCLARLRPGGAAVVTVTTAAASRRAGRRIRGNLLRAGAIRAVIGLSAVPGAGSAGRSAGAASSGRDLWLVRKPATPDQAPSRILMVDATAHPELADHETLLESWQNFRCDPEQQLPEGCRAVPIVDLLDEDIDLTPARWGKTTVTSVDPAREFDELHRQWQELVAELPGTVPQLSGAGGGPLPRTTIGELTKAGMVVVHQAPLRMTVEGGDVPALTINDVRLDRAPTGRAEPEPGATEVRPGDVVVALARETAVRVMSDGGALLGPQLLLLRPDPEQVDVHFLACCLRAADIAGTARSSSSSGRFDPRRVAVPQLDVVQQRAWGATYRQLVAMENRLQEAAALGGHLVRSALLGLTTGALSAEQAARDG